MPHIKDYTGKRAHMIGIGGSLSAIRKFLQV